MKAKIILLTLISGTAALLLAQQTQYQPAAPGNPNAPTPNNVITTQSVAPQNISTQNISGQNFSANTNFMTGTNSQQR
ncbi:MAG TPA: hypothetical protein VN516_06915 [Candidatus Baltobacteraceae bacterium]|nr:hypothetical protein [Candidatus Baltobacteraceae bacterium]